MTTPKRNTSINLHGSDKTTSYSEKDLALFRKVILDKLDKAKKDNELLKSKQTRYYTRD